MHKHHRHTHHRLLEYFVLLLLMLTGFFSFVKTAGSPQNQIKIGVLMGVAYVVWGLLHHWSDRDLNWKVVIEYIAIAFLGVAMLGILLGLFT